MEAGTLLCAPGFVSVFVLIFRSGQVGADLQGFQQRKIFLQTFVTLMLVLIHSS